MGTINQANGAERSTDRVLRILRIDASARHAASVSRGLADRLVDRLRTQHPGAELVVRDLSIGLPFVNETMIEGFYTPAADRSDEQRMALALSDELVAELAAADRVVIATPIYNFSVPAALKAWIDLVCRAGLTFKYTENGPLGLLADRKTYLIAASGGVPIGGPMDFLSGYLRQVLGFIGIRDVELIAADRLGAGGDARVSAAHDRIDGLFTDIASPADEAAPVAA